MDDPFYIPAIPVKQPIGDFYVGVIGHKELLQISFADMRRIETDLDRYVGIQRKLIPGRVKEIGGFVNSIDATFPTSIVLAVPGNCARYDAEAKQLILSSGKNEDDGTEIQLFEIAKILDGQHRIEGLRAFKGESESFQLPVSIFVEADIADQAFLFATVNLAQTKVNHSLVYDLLDYSRARSPQRSCHDISVALDKFETSPFHHLIKRLGAATVGRTGETLTQATVVNSLLPFVSLDPLADREKLARGKTLKSEDVEFPQVPFRFLWVDDKDTQITRILIEYFSAIAERWPTAWTSREKGIILARTNGFKGFIRFLKILYLHEFSAPPRDAPIIPRARVREILSAVKLGDSDFTTERFPPGSSGEKILYDTLREQTKI